MLSTDVRRRLIIRLTTNPKPGFGRRVDVGVLVSYSNHHVIVDLLCTAPRHRVLSVLRATSAIVRMAVRSGGGGASRKRQPSSIRPWARGV